MGSQGMFIVAIMLSVLHYKTFEILIKHFIYKIVSVLSQII